MAYNVTNWYWLVQPTASQQAWSSASATYVPLSDASYQAWLAAGNRPTKIGSEADLAEVFTSQFPAGWPASAAQQVAALLAGGLTITSTSTPALNGTYACDAASIAHISAEMISALVNGVFADGSASVVWADIAGGQHTFPSVAAWKPFATVVGAFVAAATKVAIGVSATLPPNTATIP